MTTSIFSRSWIDIVFDGRNQQYGAYQLRKIAERNKLFAVLLSITALTVTANVLLLDNKPKNSANASLIAELDDKGERTIEDISLPPPPVDEPGPVQLPEPVTPTPPVLATEKFTTPIIVDDGAVIDTVLAQESFGELEAAAVTQKGDTGTFVVLDPPVSSGGIVQVKDWDIAEEMPEFPGGTDKLLKYIRDNTEYPAIAKENDLEGTVYVQFVVDTNGKLVNIGVAKGPHKCLNEEGLRVVKSMPRWKPGKQNGQHVRVKFVVPIKFQLS